MARFLQGVDRSVDCTAGAQAALRKPAIEGHAEFGEILANVGDDAVKRTLQDPHKRGFTEQRARARHERIDINVLIAALRLVGRQVLEYLRSRMLQGGPFGSEQLFTNGNQVFAHIGIRRKSEIFAATLEITQPGTDCQNFHLPAGVVDVVLAFDIVANRLEQIADGSAKCRVPAVRYVQRARRICRNELDLHAYAQPELRAAVGAPNFEHASYLIVVGARRQKEVDDPGAGDLHLGNGAACRHQLAQRLGNFARILAGRLGEAHGQIGGEIAVLSIARAFNFDAAAARGRRYQIFRKLRERLGEQGFNQVFQNQSVFSIGKGSAVYRKELNPLPADRRRSTSAGRALPAAPQPTAASARESAAASLAPWFR